MQKAAAAATGLREDTLMADSEAALSVAVPPSCGAGGATWMAVSSGPEHDNIASQPGMPDEDQSRTSEGVEDVEVEGVMYEGQLSRVGASGLVAGRSHGDYHGRGQGRNERLLDSDIRDKYLCELGDIFSDGIMVPSATLVSPEESGSRPSTRTVPKT
ncbi:hypothetical protein K437DRAFT_256211 [Tilletiaria anomala UBC 951]|uniref:Uncharacterized protein n=1 Tax=Tilletiaria anomala (strain ATCC 24038 / CBS 436.72 / UBC 951) TaxID=1037660 RepID=A0A066VXP5_TILAU|nr:uncharacterized protein K437DRAFT_256211 [Tilletiaria anomala UBC 951]KDN46487.1 hypothetical protein K437DRAFT_256211 [Tilletiaria anomala UBC 951]